MDIGSIYTHHAGRFCSHHLHHLQHSNPGCLRSGYVAVVRIRGPTAGGAGGLGGSSVVERGGYKYFLSGYVLLECNLRELVITSM